MECDALCSGSSQLTFMRYRLPKSSLQLLRLIIEAKVSSEPSVEFYVPTRRHIPEDRICHVHRCENLKFYIVRIFIILL
jgi:hypothetical protein